MTNHMDALKSLRSESASSERIQTVYYREQEKSNSSFAGIIFAVIAFCVLFTFLVYQHFEIASLKTEIASLSNQPYTKGIYDRLQSNEAEISELRSQVSTMQLSVSDNTTKTDQIIDVFRQAKEKQAEQKPANDNTQNLQTLFWLVKAASLL